MKQKQSSLTAAGIAVVRAVESGKPEGVRICYDPYAAKFLNPFFYRFVRFFIDSSYAELVGPGVDGFLVARCRYMDDLLQDCLNEGLQQLVILGAGYDSRPYRFEQLKHGIRVFEVDHPATQRAKMDKVRRAFGQLPDHVTYVALDLNTQAIEKRLSECGYNEHLKTLFIWEGVVMYLSHPAVEDTLSFILHHSGSGSMVVFDYIYTALVDGSVRHGEVSRMHRVKLISGEGFTFSIPEGEVKDFLEKHGFFQAIDISNSELHQRYFNGLNAKRKVVWGYGIASACVP